MTETVYEPVLPIPSRLSREITAVIDQITVLGDKLIVLDRRFRALQARPSVVAVDDLGPATTAEEATASVRRLARLRRTRPAVRDPGVA